MQRDCVIPLPVDQFRSPTSWAVICLLKREWALRPIEICRALQRSQTGTRQLLLKMVRRKLVYREPGGRYRLWEPPSSRTNEDKRRGYVYFIRPMGMEFIKIGFSVNDVRKRIAALSTAWPLPLLLLLVLDGGMAFEQEMHRRFSHLRIRGEWFTAADDLYEFIEAESDKQDGSYWGSTYYPGEKFHAEV